MPHTTHAYLFEFKIFDFAGHISKSMTGGNRKFIMTLTADGAVQTLSFVEPATSWRDYLEQLRANDQPHFFYDPFDAPEYTYICWHKIDRHTMERLINESFEASDFDSFEWSSGRSPELKSPEPFQETWGVMF